MTVTPLSLTTTGAQLSATLLEQGLRVRVRVSGTSMAPALVDGDVVHLAPVNAESLHLGDILYVQDPRHGYYLHRLLRRTHCGGQAQLQTRGDHHWRLDDPVHSAQVLARVTDIEYHTARWRHWLGWAFSISSPGAALLARIELLQSACYYLLQRLIRAHRLKYP